MRSDRKNENIDIPSLVPANVSADIFWWENVRRAELLKLFSEHIYGVTPDELPKIEYKLSNGYCAYPDVEKTTLTIAMVRNGKSCAFRSDIYRPAGVTGHLPAVIMIDPFSKNPWYKGARCIYNHCPPDIITAAGFVAIHAHVDEACPDSKKYFNEGLLTLYPPKDESGWGAIGAWAFSASRVIDYLLTLGDIKHDGVAVCGHSRGAKAALWCGAQDDRAALCISNQSGCSGAALARGKTGERIADIVKRFPYWFCPEYKSFAGRERDLPVDQHMLLSLIAPRPLYISSAAKDSRACPKNEFKAAQLCGEIYNLYGKQGLPDIKLPKAGSSFPAGDIGYHIKKGRHSCDLSDWQHFLPFMKKYL